LSIKIYHIVHIDKLQSIINSGMIYSDAQVIAQNLGGTTIGVNSEDILHKVNHVLQSSYHKPVVEIRNNWYY